MPEIVSVCPLCGADRSRPFDRRHVQGAWVTNVICARCGLVFQSPRLTPAEADAFYAHEYRRLYQGAEGPNPKDLRAQAGRASSLLLLGREWLPTGAVNRYLDIGCSAGVLLERFQQGFGAQVVGVEPGDAYRAYAQSRGLTVYSSLEALAAAQTAPFDLISLAHVLEHLPDPVAYLRDLRRDWLAPTGHLLLEVPNLYAHDSFEVAHLFAFSPHTLAETLRQAGFAVTQQHLHGLPRSEMLPLYLTALAAPLAPRPDAAAPAPVRPERGVALKRRLGLLRRTLLTRWFPQRAWLPQPPK
jgi:2-polyprenyl-3-methyl-5-hydroxy-6-metoxy-1,4-benzoquinol methylase